MRSGIARGVALFFGAFALLNAIGDLRFARANANIWWLDVSILPLPLARAFLITLGAALLLVAFRSRLRRVASIVIAIGAAFALLNIVSFYVAIARARVHPAIPLPLSLLVLVALIATIIESRKSDSAAPPAVVAASFVAAVLFFPVAQVCFFGTTDYRQPADVAIVPGARALANGTPSDALADRVATACELYRAGLVKRLIFSGGPGEGAFTEPEVMSRFAQTLQVPPAAIVEDPQGITTEATVRNTAAMLSSGARVLVVSHFYHLPRIKMTYQRYGIDVRTVPSRDTVPFSMPFNIFREDAAFWVYYLRRIA